MYITCEQCSTIFRLDETLLKPAGSKVRCSQCRHVFMAHPPEPVAAVEQASAFAPAFDDQSPQSRDTFDQGLEGIDLAELDSILEQGRSSEVSGVDADQAESEVADEPVEFDEADLDMDFESELTFDDEEIDIEESVAEEEIEEVEAVDEELDLDMDFDLDDGDDDLKKEVAIEENSSDLDLDMDFNLEEDLSRDTAEIAEPEESDLSVDDSLTEDIDAALDGFEEILEPAGEMDQQETITDKTDTDLLADELEDLDLDDIDSLMEDEADESPEAPLAEELELSLDDGIDEEPEVSTPVDEDDSLDLSDLDEMLGEDDTSPGADAEMEDLELSLDDDTGKGLEEVTALELEADEDVSLDDSGKEDELDFNDIDTWLDEDDKVADAIDSPDQELGLNEDVELPLDEKSAPESDAITPAEESDEFDLTDLENMLDEDEPPADSGGEAVGDDELVLEMESDSADESDAAEDDFDLSELSDSVLEGDEVEAKDSIDDDLGLSLDDDLGLSLEDEPEPEPFSEDSVDDDLELSLDDDLGLSLEDEPEPELSSDPMASEEGNDLEDLDFELDSEFEDKPIADQNDEISLDEAPVEKEIEAQGEVDLSDIEKMLEDDTIVPAAMDATISADSDLDSDDLLSAGSEDGEIDLAEIEAAIDGADAESQDELSLDDEEDIELDLELDESESVDKPEESKEPEESEDFDLDLDLDLDLEMDDKPAAGPEATGDEESDELGLAEYNLSLDEDKTGNETHTINTGDIQLEFKIEDEDDEEFEAAQTFETYKTTDVADAVTGSTTGFTDEDSFAMDDTITTEPMVEKPAAAVAKKPKKKGGGSGALRLILLIILFLAALGAGGYFGYDYIKKNNINIPYLSDYINPEVKDPSGIVQLSTMEIEGKFVPNETAGRLFIINGKVHNGYPVARKTIRLTGKLFNKDKAIIKTEQAVVGAVLTDQELSSMAVEEIKKRLVQISGQDVKVTVNAGKRANFMVVFTDLPPDTQELDHYTIELNSSTVAQ